MLTCERRLLPTVRIVESVPPGSTATLRKPRFAPNLGRTKCGAVKLMMLWTNLRAKLLLEVLGPTTCKLSRQVMPVLKLAVRGATILQAKKGTHPSLPEHDPNTDKGKPKGRKYTKDVGRGPGHSTRKNYLQDLVEGKDSHPHTRKWRKSLVECSTCRLTISVCNTWKVIHAKIKRPCRARNLARRVRAGELTQEQADKLRAEAQQSSLTEPQAAHANLACPDGEATKSMPANVSHARAHFLDNLAASTQHHDATKRRLKLTKHQMRCERCGATMPNRAGQEVLEKIALEKCIIVHPTTPKKVHSSHQLLGVGPRMQCIHCFGTLYVRNGQIVGRNANEFPQNLMQECTRKPHQARGHESEHLRQALQLPHVAAAYGQS